MSAVAAIPAVEVIEGDVRKSLAVAPIRYGTHASLSLTFDRRYRRGIQLSPAQLAAHIRNCTDVLNQLSEDR